MEYRLRHTGQQIDDAIDKANSAIQLGQLKTINGQSIIGEGNIEIQSGGDTSELATKVELQTLQDALIEDEEAIATALNKLNERIAELEKLLNEING